MADTFYVQTDVTGGAGGDGTGIPGTTGSTRPFKGLREAADATDGNTNPIIIYCDGAKDDDDGSNAAAVFDNHSGGVTILPYTGNENTSDGVLDTGKYYLSAVTQNESISVQDDGVTIDNIQFAVDGSGAYGATGVYIYHSPDGSNCVVQNCVFKMIYTGAGTSRWPKGVNMTYDPTNPIIRNCLFDGFSTSGSTGAGIYKYNNGSFAGDYNTIVNCYHGVRLNSSITPYLRNNLFYNCTNDVSEAGSNTTTNITNNYTDLVESTTSGLPSSQSNSYEASYTFEAAGSGDYRITSASDGYQGATSLKTDGTDAIDVDFAGNDRNDSTPDVGFYEVQAGSDINVTPVFTGTAAVAITYSLDMAAAAGETSSATLGSVIQSVTPVLGATVTATLVYQLGQVPGAGSGSGSLGPRWTLGQIPTAPDGTGTIDPGTVLEATNVTPIASVTASLASTFGLGQIPGAPAGSSDNAAPWTLGQVPSAAAVTATAAGVTVVVTVTPSVDGSTAAVAIFLLEQTPTSPDGGSTAASLLALNLISAVAAAASAAVGSVTVEVLLAALDEAVRIHDAEWRPLTDADWRRIHDAAFRPVAGDPA